MESTRIYSTFIDPILKPMRKRVSHKIKDGQNVIDIACGTGVQVIDFSTKAKRAVGIDLLDSMIDYAKSVAKKSNLTNVEFYVCDATALSLFRDNEFDVACMSLALHQFNPELYVPVLGEMRRIAKKIIITDYAFPLPKNYMGYGSRIAEFLAGKEHNSNFKHFNNLGGLENILPTNNFTIEHSEKFGKNAFQLAVCSYL